MIINEADYIVFEPDDGACFSAVGRQSISCALPIDLFAPPGARIAVVKQTNNILTALTVGNDGALSVSWVVGTEEWNGPVPISPAGFAPSGAGIAMAKQTNDILTTLTVANNRALSVSWVVGIGNWNSPIQI
ncbi:hypothetical protein [Chlorogloeopsis sp. ULAP02]|uniref:hypothetical protein n=1 Tax=Chlorogloeopsis sp. ULAP02 TaxID=3107926 RepID=UPI0031373931